MNEDKSNELTEIIGGTLSTEHIRAVEEENRDEPAELVAEPSGGSPWIYRLESIEQALKGLTETVAGLARSQEIMQGAMHQLAVRVGEAATSLAPPRIYSLYTRLLMLYDIVSPPPIGFSEDAQRLASIFAKQIEEFLAVSGYERISADGELFDPAIHKPVEFMNAEDPAQVGRVVAVRRNGFRSGAQVLRPAEVALAREVPGPALRTDMESPADSNQKGD